VANRVVQVNFFNKIAGLIAVMKARVHTNVHTDQFWFASALTNRALADPGLELVLRTSGRSLGLKSHFPSRISARTRPLGKSGGCGWGAVLALSLENKFRRFVSSRGSWKSCDCSGITELRQPFQ
jgi:hypothetical protein